MVVFGLGEGHSRNLSMYLLLLLEYSFPLKPTWEDTREKPWHPVQQLASYPQLATEAGVNPEWDLQQLLKSLQDHATALSSLNYYFYFIYDLCGLTVWVCVPRGMCGGQGQFMSLVLFCHLSTFIWVPGIKLRWLGLHYEGASNCQSSHRPVHAAESRGFKGEFFM